MEERRRHKRLELDVKIKLEYLDDGENTASTYVHIDVTDISRSGIGFQSSEELEIGTYYDARIQIWNKEVVDAVIQIVRREDAVDGIYKYGGSFVGMTDADAMKIDIYQIFNDV